MVAERSERLGGAERRALRRQAHALHAVVQLRSAGVTDALIGAVDRALEDHELIKLRLGGERDLRASLASVVAERTGSELAGLVGKVAILYRPASDPARRRIDPRRRSAR
jgi:RNA-binding protein